LTCMISVTLESKKDQGYKYLTQLPSLGGAAS